MSIKKLSFMLLSAFSLAALLSGCGSSSKKGSPADTAKVASEGICIVCHATSIDQKTGTLIVQEFADSGHNPALGRSSAAHAPGCQGCHGGGSQHNGVGPMPYPNPFNIALKADGTPITVCINCHVGAYGKPDALWISGGKDFKTNCAPCHTKSRVGSIHAVFPLEETNNCVGCHDVAGPNHGTDLVNDNNGVRAILPEFDKRSHHITGAKPTNGQCAVCHLEGKVVDGKVVVNSDYHMKDNKVHLRHSDTNADLAWSGTNHDVMDNFCFSCHDSNGAAGLHATGLNEVNNGSAANPFGDTLTNSYDQVARPRVVDVKTAFTVTNASHHAVSGKRYVYRFSTRVNADAWAVRNGKAAGSVPNSEIAEFNPTALSTLDGTAITQFDKTEPYDPKGTHEGGMATLYEADKFVATYLPLGDTKNVADNSLLHCGDCHTVGQWKAGSSTNADGTATTAAIGAHGSNNDYLLRNSLGTDALHSSQTYVCFNCHKGGQLAPYNGNQVVAATAALFTELKAEGFIASSVAVPTWSAGWNATHPNRIAGQVSGYATAHAVSAFHAQCIADSSNQVGSAGTPDAPVLSRVWYTTGGGHKDRMLDFYPAPGATAALPTTASEGGNITGIGCTNCHNSGLRSGWGGIHGGNLTYTDGLGRSQKTYRFMPGMGNYRYAPPGGWDGNDLTDATLTTKATSGVGAGKGMGGCYTNAAADANNGFSSCAHHGTSTAQTTAGMQAAGGRATYGGGTAATPTAVEPTVREATAGNSLVTRPLKY